MRSITTESFCRAELERHIEEMIALLDIMDGDTDLEDGGDDVDYNSGMLMEGAGV